MKAEDILKVFEKSGALMRGHFLLSSGLHSEQYLQCALVLQYPEYAQTICSLLAERFRSYNPNIVIAPALGGVLVSYEVARALKIKSFFTERVEGRMTLRRGFELYGSDSCLVLEDVMTTGISAREVVETVKGFGSKVVGVGCIVNRSKEKIDFGVPFVGLLNLDIPTFRPEDCPLCRKNIPLVKPGSR